MLLETAGPDNKPKHHALRSKAMKLIQLAHLAKIEERKSVALGNDLRLESEQFIGSGLEFEDQIIQLSIFQAMVTAMVPAREAGCGGLR